MEAVQIKGTRTVKNTYKEEEHASVICWLLLLLGGSVLQQLQA